MPIKIVVLVLSTIFTFRVFPETQYSFGLPGLVSLLLVVVNELPLVVYVPESAE